jgi:hypothetical protein
MEIKWIVHLVVFLLMNEFVMKEKVWGSGKQKHEERRKMREQTLPAQILVINDFYKHAGWKMVDTFEIFKVTLSSTPSLILESLFHLQFECVCVYWVKLLSKITQLMTMQGS